jgi:hypothetical protein
LLFIKMSTDVSVIGLLLNNKQIVEVQYVHKMSTELCKIRMYL